METMTPYSPRTSAKIRMSTIPTYKRGCCVLARTIHLISFCNLALPCKETTLTSSIPNNTNRETRSHSAESHGQSSAQLHETRVDGHFLFDGAGDDDAGDEAVDGEDLGHDGA